MKQFIKSKLIKNDFKLYFRCSSKSRYLYQMDIFIGRKETPEFNLGEEVVLQLTKNLEQSFCTVCFDNFFTHPASRPRSDVVTTSVCMSQQRRSYISDETPNDASVEGRQDVSVVRFHDILLERCNDVSRGHNNNVPSVRLPDVSNKCQTKHPTTSQWYVIKTSQWQWYVSLTYHYYVSTTFPVSPK